MYTYEPTEAADTTAPSPINTCSPIDSGKKAILKRYKAHEMHQITTQLCGKKWQLVVGLVHKATHTRC